MTAKDEVSTESLGGFLEEMSPKLRLGGEAGSWLAGLTKDKNDKTPSPAGCLWAFGCVPKSIGESPGLPTTTDDPAGDGENRDVLILSTLFSVCIITTTNATSAILEADKNLRKNGRGEK